MPNVEQGRIVWANLTRNNLNGISIDLRHQTYEVILFSNKFTKVYGVGDFICDNDRWRATPAKRQDTVCIRGPDRE